MTPLIKVTIKIGIKMSFLRIFVHEDLKIATPEKKKRESNVIHTSDVIGGSPFKESIVRIGNRDHKTADENTDISTTLSLDKFFIR